MYNMVTLDGYFAGSDGNIDWHMVDDEFNKFATELIVTIDTALFGRVTYDLFEGYWPKVAEDTSQSPEDNQIAHALNNMRKIVVTHNELKSDWQNSEAWHDIGADRINELKNQDGKNIVIYGSGTITRQLTELGLIDEYQLIVAPVLLGSGKTLFEGNSQRQLELTGTRVFDSGNVLLKYAPKTAA